MIKSKEMGDNPKKRQRKAKQRAQSQHGNVANPVITITGTQKV